MILRRRSIHSFLLTIILLIILINANYSHARRLSFIRRRSTTAPNQAVPPSAGGRFAMLNKPVQSHRPHRLATSTITTSPAGSSKAGLVHKPKLFGQPERENFLSSIFDRINVLIAQASNRTSNATDGTTGSNNNNNGTRNVPEIQKNSTNYEKFQSWNFANPSAADQANQNQPTGFAQSSEKFQQTFSRGGTFQPFQTGSQLNSASPSPLAVYAMNRDYLWRHQVPTAAPLNYYNGHVFFTFPRPIYPDNMQPVGTITLPEGGGAKTEPTTVPTTPEPTTPQHEDYREGERDHQHYGFQTNPPIDLEPMPLLGPADDYNMHHQSDYGERPTVEETPAPPTPPPAPPPPPLPRPQPPQTAPVLPGGFPVPLKIVDPSGNSMPQEEYAPLQAPREDQNYVMLYNSGGGSNMVPFMPPPPPPPQPQPATLQSLAGPRLVPAPTRNPTTTKAPEGSNESFILVPRNETVRTENGWSRHITVISDGQPQSWNPPLLFPGADFGFKGEMFPFKASQSTQNQSFDDWMKRQDEKLPLSHNQQLQKAEPMPVKVIPVDRPSDPQNSRQSPSPFSYFLFPPFSFPRLNGASEFPFPNFLPFNQNHPTKTTTTPHPPDCSKVLSNNKAIVAGSAQVLPRAPVAIYDTDAKGSIFDTGFVLEPIKRTTTTSTTTPTPWNSGYNLSRTFGIVPMMMNFGDDDNDLATGSEVNVDEDYDDEEEEPITTTPKRRRRIGSTTRRPPPSRLFSMFGRGPLMFNKKALADIASDELVLHKLEDAGLIENSHHDPRVDEILEEFIHYYHDKKDQEDRNVDSHRRRPERGFKNNVPKLNSHEQSSEHIYNETISMKISNQAAPPHMADKLSRRSLSRQVNTRQWWGGVPSA